MTDTATVDVTVTDLVGQEELVLPRMDPATPVGDLIGISRTRMGLSPSQPSNSS